MFFVYCSYRGDGGGRRLYELERVAPGQPNPAHFDEAIAGVSPGFVAIFNQASAAEHYGLDQIAGVGYRKSLEFLVKDFIIAQDSTKEATVKNSPLGAVITEHIDDANLKGCAARATWLGNDETHYVRKWTSRDITDLKKLIRLTVLWIEKLLYTEEFLREMPDPKKPGD